MPEPSPTTTLYTSYLLRVVSTAPFAEGLSSHLPCLIHPAILASIHHHHSYYHQHQQFHLQPAANEISIVTTIITTANTTITTTTGLSALLPCFIVYHYVGIHLLARRTHFDKEKKRNEEEKVVQADAWLRPGEYDRWIDMSVIILTPSHKQPLPGNHHHANSHHPNHYHTTDHQPNHYQISSPLPH